MKKLRSALLAGMLITLMTTCSLLGDLEDYRPGDRNTSFATGTGIPMTNWCDYTQNSFTINDPDQLAGLAVLVGEGKNFSSKVITLGANLNLSCYGPDNEYNDFKGWLPIGNHGAPFTGTFDGGGKTIKGLAINDSTDNDYSLFGRIGSGGVVKKLKLENVAIKGMGHVGGVAGRNEGGTLLDCSVSGALEILSVFDAIIGGVVGYNNGGQVENCSFTSGSVKSAGNGVITGGIVGCTILGNVFNCHFSGSVICSGDGSPSGGIVGHSDDGQVENCSSSGAVTSTGGTNPLGGIVGNNGGGVRRCYTTGPVSGIGQVGGIAGINQDACIVEDCYASGAFTGTSNNIGGIAGENYGIVHICYASGSVSGLGSVGGVIGANGNTGIVENCVALNSSIIASYDKGRVIGANEGTPNFIYGAYSLWPMGLYVLDGDDVPGQYPAASWWVSPAGFTIGVWSMADGRYPTLK